LPLGNFVSGSNLCCIYQNQTVPIYEERLSERSPSYLKEPPAKQQLAKNDGKSVVNLGNLSKELLFESLVLSQ